jgi:hypothetical protein
MIFVSIVWEAAFPLAGVLALAKGTVDNNPPLIDFRDNCYFGKKKVRFENWCLERRDFKDIVLKAWETN